MDITPAELRGLVEVLHERGNAERNEHDFDARIRFSLKLEGMCDDELLEIHDELLLHGYKRPAIFTRKEILSRMR